MRSTQRSAAQQKALGPDCCPSLPVGTEAGQTLSVTVVFTTRPATLAALQRAGELAHELGAQIRILVPQVVPYPLPLDRPPVNMAQERRRLRILADESAIETRIEIRLCRDAAEAIRQSLLPHSIVVMGDRHRWRPTPEKKLARALRRNGHHVIVVEPSGGSHVIRRSVLSAGAAVLRRCLGLHEGL